MKKKRFKESQIVSFLRQQEAGKPTKVICREQRISEATFYNCEAKYGGMEVSDVRKMKELEEEIISSSVLLLTLLLKTMLSKQYLKKVRRPDDKRYAVELLVNEKLSVRQACRIVGIPCSVMNFEKVPKDDSSLIEALHGLVEKASYDRFLEML